jgi:hypothetical protein
MKHQLNDVGTPNEAHVLQTLYLLCYVMLCYVTSVFVRFIFIVGLNVVATQLHLFIYLFCH